MDDVPDSVTTATAVNPRTMMGMMRINRDAIFISYVSIFFPRYSGVRPTIRPAMNTAMIAKINIP